MATTTLDRSVEKIRAAYDRALQILERRPEKARGTARTRVRLDGAFTCRVTEGDWELTADFPEKWGGSDEGPNPGILGRAALGTCLAMAYRRWAAENELSIRSLTIDIEADYDARGELGLADISPAYTAARYIVSVDTDAPEEEVRRVFDLAEERCPYLHVWQDPVPVTRELRIG
ncbi:MAG: OsmC family protein [Gemmatimonadota bacterium]|nr:OsmC family protein [Gemmatimonadota bacterium]